MLDLRGQAEQQMAVQSQRGLEVHHRMRTLRWTMKSHHLPQTLLSHQGPSTRGRQGKLPALCQQHRLIGERC